MVAPKEPSDMERYFAACHAVQTGVAYDLERDPNSGTPKHLRVGVNIAQRDLSSLVELLVALKVITLEQYESAIAQGMEKEQKRYEELLSRRFGTVVKLA